MANFADEYLMSDLKYRVCKYIMSSWSTRREKYISALLLAFKHKYENVARLFLPLAISLPKSELITNKKEMPLEIFAELLSCQYDTLLAKTSQMTHSCCSDCRSFLFRRGHFVSCSTCKKSVLPFDESVAVCQCYQANINELMLKFKQL